MSLALKRLIAKDMPRLSSWEGDFAADLLSYLFDQEDSTVIMQCKRLLGDDAQRSLCKQLSLYGHFSMASQLAREIEVFQLRIEALGEIAVEQAKINRWEDAFSTLAGSVAKIIFLQFDTIFFTFMCHFLPNEID